MIMLPSGREKLCLISSIICASLNFILNLFLIPIWGLNAAALTTAISEATGFFFLSRFVEKKIKIEHLWKIMEGPIIGGAGIVLVAEIVKHLIQNYYLITILTVIFSIIIYTFSLYILKNELFENFINSVKK